MSGLRVRDVTDADLPAIRDIYNHYVRSSTVTFDEVESVTDDWVAKAARIAEAGIPFLVAETADGELLGYALGRSVQLSDEPLIDTLVQSPGHRAADLVELVVRSPQFRTVRGRSSADGGAP